MYSRRDFGDRIPRIPRNYSGNAFREAVVTAPAEELSAADVPEVSEASEAVEAVEAVKDAPKEEALPMSRGLFRSGGGIGSEELLLLGLVLLLSQNEKQDDLLPLLLLLLLMR